MGLQDFGQIYSSQYIFFFTQKVPTLYLGWHKLAQDKWLIGAFQNLLRPLENTLCPVLPRFPEITVKV
jgi:hypothetical protein